MQNLPAEGTVAGDILAVMLVGGPAVAVLLSVVIPSKLGAFLAAVFVAAFVCGFGALYAINTTPGAGTELGAAIFGGAGFGLSVMASAITVGGRALWRRPVVPEETSKPDQGEP